MHLRNRLTNTRPLVIHNNGKTNNCPSVWQKVTTIALSQPKQCIPCDLTIFTWNTRPKPGLLEQCLSARNIECKVLGSNIKTWANKLKTGLNITFLETIKTKYVMALDSYDVILLGCPAKILEMFMSFDCNMLFSAEKNSYPKEPMLTDFEQKLTLSPYPFLNGGCWIGEAGFCLSFFKDSLKQKGFTKSPRDDQGIIRQQFQEVYPKAKLDNDCKIFQNLFLAKDEEFDFGQITLI